MTSPLKFALAAAGITNADSIYEVDESPPAVPRIDLPLQVQNRGTTRRQTTPQERANRELHQHLLWSKQTIHKNTTAAKLRALGRSQEAKKLERCHTIFTVARCTACGLVQKFPNRCDLFFCAECQPRLSSDRKRAVEWWTREVRQPKHVVLTVKNLPDLRKAHKVELLKWFTNLRKRKFCRNWIGGFYSIEVTNQGKGWHLHMHILVNAKWVDAIELSEQWRDVTNGFGYIVKVKDARNTNYLAEVTKYAVKGVQLAAWTPEDIVTFIDAFNGVRTFGVFGDLYGKRTEFAAWFKAIRDAKPSCKCGCSNMHFMSELEFLERDFQPTVHLESLPPPTIPHPEFAALLEILPAFGPR